MIVNVLKASMVLGVLMATLPGEGRAQVSWPQALYDPAGPPNEMGRDGAADLILPMPCGGAMAFQQVNVPVALEDPLSDRRVRFGDPGTANGYSDYLHTDYLRGPFKSADGIDSHYWIARYELTVDQAAALRGECQERSGPSLMAGRFPETGLSQLDAMILARDYTNWLLVNAASNIPEGAGAYFRLPTNAEWEYAARGGMAVAPDEFNASRYPGTADADDLLAHAWMEAPGSAQDQQRPVGLLRPNPLGLYDIYGSVEELILDPFRMNALGRAHGQPGGIVTRGGSISSTPGQITSARRSEWAPYLPSGGEMRLDSFGVRFVIGRHVTTSDATVNRIVEAWQDALTTGGDGSDQDPLEALHTALEAETDQKRRADLEAIRQLVLQREREVDESRQSALKATLLSGAVIIEILRDETRDQRNTLTVIGSLERALSLAPDQSAAQTVSERLTRLRTTQGIREERINAAIASFARTLVTTVTDYEVLEINRAQNTLESELNNSGQLALIPVILDFREDLRRYRTTPNLTRDDVMSLALE